MKFDVFKKEGPGYKDKGFRYTEAEFKEEMAKLLAMGRTEEEAREIVLTQELLARTKQEIAKKEKVKDARYDVGNIGDWAA